MGSSLALPNLFTPFAGPEGPGKWHWGAGGKIEPISKQQLHVGAVSRAPWNGTDYQGEGV